jgi:hypothetical protein
MTLNKQGHENGSLQARNIHFKLGQTVYYLTPRRRFLLEKLTFIEVVQKFLAFWRTRNVIAVFTELWHWSLSWAKWIRSKFSYHISLKCKKKTPGL